MLNRPLQQRPHHVGPQAQILSGEAQAWRVPAEKPWVGAQARCRRLGNGLRTRGAALLKLFDRLQCTTVTGGIIMWLKNLANKRIGGVLGQVCISRSPADDAPRDPTSAGD